MRNPSLTARKRGVLRVPPETDPGFHSRTWPLQPDSSVRLTLLTPRGTTAPPTATGDSGDAVAQGDQRRHPYGAALSTSCGSAPLGQPKPEHRAYGSDILGFRRTASCRVRVRPVGRAAGA